jgi:hypothetical protein
MDFTSTNQSDPLHLTSSKAGMWARWFVVSCGAILFVTGVAKILSAFGKSQILEQHDPFFKISFRQLMVFVGSLELLVSALCFWIRKPTTCLLLIAWLSSNFLAYRIGLWWINYQKPCSCLGNLMDAVHLSPGLVNLGMKCILSYLLIGSNAMLFLHSKLDKKRRMSI